MPETLLGTRELDVMAVLWELGSGTVTEVREILPADLAYTTVLTILRNLEEKEFVRHEAEGRAHRYFPAMARESAQRTLLSRLIDRVFHGSAEQLMAHLIDEQQLTTEDLRRLSKRIASRKPARAKKDAK